MNITKNKSRTYKGKPYYKHIIVIPNKTIKLLNWDTNTQLEHKISKTNSLIIKKIGEKE